ncbi:MAG: PQQ-like beta-propeller repeat protein [Verrucomicrobia bacterium]|nr:PQQ-like beta-propeller repeat protein [Verrucomicrobiota bacterium]
MRHTLRTAVIAGWLLAATTVSADDWPWFLGPTHDGVSAEKNLLARWPAEGPRVLWRATVGLSYSSPSIADGRAFVFHRLGGEEILDCLDAVTGEKRWRASCPTAYKDRYGYNNGPRSTPVVAGGRVFTFGAEGRFTCFDAAAGKQLWQRPLNDEYKVEQNFFGVGGSPLLEGKLLLVNVGGSPDAGIVALDKETGATVWQATDEGASYGTPLCATLGGQRVAFVFARGGLVCLEPATGKALWRFPFRSKLHESVNAASPVVAGDCVFVSASYKTGGALLRVRKDGYDVVWSDEAMSNHWATSIHRDGFLYGFNGRHEYGTTLRCVEWATGKLRCEQPALGRGSMIWADGRFIILSERGRLILAHLKPEGFEEIGGVQLLDYPCWIAPVLANGLLYIRNESQLICLDLRGNSAP